MPREKAAYFVDEEYLVTALVPSETACLASSPGKISLTLWKMLDMDDMHENINTYEVWISRAEMVDFLLYAASLDASVATRSKISGKRVRSRVEPREVETYRSRTSSG